MRATLSDNVYRALGPLGARLLKIFRFLERDVKRSGLGLHPEVYASYVVLVLAASAAGAGALYLALLPKLPPLVGPLLLAVPLAALGLMLAVPKVMASNAASAIDSEFPYGASYLSMLVESGLSPYAAFERLSLASLTFKNLATLGQRFYLLTRVLGKDPLSAFSAIAEATPSPIARETLLGYVSVARSGGDVIHYMNEKARALLTDLVSKVRIVADRLGGVLESYLAVVLLTMITFAVMYFVTNSFASVIPFGMGGGSFFLLMYILLPLLSFAIIYVADLLQFKEPYTDWMPYVVASGTFLPIFVLTLSLGWLLYTSLPPYSPLKENPLLLGLYRALTWPALVANLPDYTWSSVALSMALIYASLPAVIYYEARSREYRVASEITRFLRDLVEVRKTGLSPEKSIIELSRRDYGRFSRTLRKVAMGLSAGLPLVRLSTWARDQIKSWRGRVLMQMLIDAIEMGGGTVEVLEELASFAERMEAVEEEKRRSLRTLMVVPYMGAVLSSITVILMAAYVGQLPVSVAAYRAAAEAVLPSVVLNTYIMGLVAGKISSGITASGFKHAVILTIAALASMMFMPILGVGGAA
ncbi:MAG: type II secretion system F family protein [Desulfurococcaceae archaeon]